MTHAKESSPGTTTYPPYSEGALKHIRDAGFGAAQCNSAEHILRLYATIDTRDDEIRRLREQADSVCCDGGEELDRCAREAASGRPCDWHHNCRLYDAVERERDALRARVDKLDEQLSKCVVDLEVTGENNEQWSECYLCGECGAAGDESDHLESCALYDGPVSP